MWRLLPALLLLANAAAAEQALVPRLEGAELVAALRAGGHVILLRHASTTPARLDPETFELRNCKTQRNLSEAGREEARRIGRAFATLGIPVGEVLSSPYCRCLDTGRLAFGRVTESELLSVWDDLSVSEKSERGAQVRQLLATPPPGGNTVLITHTGTLLYSFGLDSQPEGIAHVFRPTEGIGSSYLGRLTPDELQELVTAATE